MEGSTSSELNNVPDEASAVELPCFSAATCFVHGNIPFIDTCGHRADSWNVAKPDYTCKLESFTRGDTFIIRLRTEEGELFAESFWEPERPMQAVIDAAVDSSRYFALRIDNPENGSHVFIGIGFNDRDTAGHFKLTLSEHGRYLDRMKRAKQELGASPGSSSPGTSGSPAGTPDRAKDMSLKENIRVSLPKVAGSNGSAIVGAHPIIPLAGIGLAPPPKDNLRSKSGRLVHSAGARGSQEKPAYEENEFGAFVG